MRLFINFGKEKIDLQAITADNCRDLDKRPKDERDHAVRCMLKEFSSEELLYTIEYLSPIYFDKHGVLFIRKGTSSFLADIIKACVNKYDGERFAQIYFDNGTDGLLNFKFSKESTAIFYLLRHEASKRAYNDPQYVEFIASNICNKIWLPIIVDRAAKLFRLEEVSTLLQALQSLAEDSNLLNAILNSNLDIEKAYGIAVASQDGSTKSPVTENGFFHVAQKKADSASSSLLSSTCDY